jgi:hypothetical protein
MDVRSLFSDAFSVTQDCIALNEGMIREWWIEKDVEWCGRGLIYGTIAVFVWRNLGKPRNPSVRIAYLPADIWTRDLPNTKQECYLSHDVS